MATPAAPTIDYNVSIDTNVGTQRIDWEYSDMLIHQRESAFPFTAFMIKLALEKALTSTIYWFDTRPAPESDTVGADFAQSSVGTARVVTVGTPKFFKVNDTIEFPSSAVVAGTSTNMGFVSAVGSTTIDVKPFDPSIALAAGVSGDPINILYTSYEQGSGTTTPSLTRPIRASNTSTILRDSYQVTKTYENERLFGVNERSRARAEKEIRHLVDLNKLLLFGKDLSSGGETTYTTNIRTTTKGFENFVVSNVFSYGVALTSDKLFDYMTQIHQNSYGADGSMDKRLVFCSSAFLSAINKMTLPSVRFNNYATTWGANVTQLQWAPWTWELVHDPSLTKFRQGQAFVIQPRYLKYRPYRPTTFRANIQNPEVDYIKDEFLTEAIYEHRLEEVHAIIKP